MKKVIVRLGNGLGNQLFTYAAAYAFAKKSNAQLYIDDESGFYKRHKYELHNFKISTPIADKKNKFLGKMGRLKRKLIKKFDIKNFFFIEDTDKEKLSYYNPSKFQYDFENILYFEGYFQSEIYFEMYKKDILKEFSFIDNVVNEQPQKIINNIKNSNSVSIHLRQENF